MKNGTLNYATKTNAPDLGYLPIGIPFLLGGHGTSIPLTKDLSLTAKHVAVLSYNRVVKYHQSCDVALIKEDNSHKDIQPLGLVKSLDPVETYGKGLMGRLIVGEGKYYTDVNFVDSDLFEKCPASITDAPVQSGMSGGGVMNRAGEVVGVISGISGDGFRLLSGESLGNERTSVFVSTLHIRDWLIEQVDAFYDKNDNEGQLHMSEDFQLAVIDTAAVE